MRHVKLANGSAVGFPAAERQSDSEICFVDYSHCPESDLCWLMDLGAGCSSKDNCIIDTG